MRIVHLADLHLGFRQFQRMNASGINQREADVALAFQRAVDKVIELRPDVVLIAGDVFHVVRPPNPAILHAFNQFARLAAELPDALVVMIAGNHDTPRAVEKGCILRLFEQLGVSVVDSGPRRIAFPDRDLSVLAVPDLADTTTIFAPDPACRFNILLTHAEVRGVVPTHALPDERPAMQVDRADLQPDSWDYIALGHYHVFRQVAPNAFYSGSLEYTSSNPWGEIREEMAHALPGKGFVEYDLDSREHTFHHVQGNRVFVDLPPLSARGLTSLELGERIDERVEECVGGIDNKVVRLVVRDVPRHIVRELDQSVIRAYKRRAFHFILDTRKPETRQVHGHGAPGTRRSLEDTVREKLNSRVLESDMNRQELIELAVGYLRQADAAEVVRPEEER